MKLAVALLVCLLWLPGVSHATILFMDGYESGDDAAWGSGGIGSVNGTRTIDSSIFHGGAYSYQYSTTNNTQPNVYKAILLSSPQTTTYLRWYFRVDTFPASIPFGKLDIFEWDSTTVILSSVGIQSDSGGHPSLWLANWQTGSPVQIGSSFTISKNTWYRLELKQVANSSTGILELKVNGNVVATGSSLNTGGNMSFLVPEIAGFQTLGTVTTHIDDFLLKTDAYPGDGSIIARQCNTATPTFNTWSFSTGSNPWSVWDNTPSGSTYAYSSTASAKQTCGLSFNNTTDTGATGHGPGKITSTSVINAAQIDWYCRNIGSDLTQDSSIWFPNGGSETDTLGPLAYTNNGGAVFESTLIATPTAAQVLNLQSGILHTSANSNEHDVFTVWTMVDYSPGLTVAHKSGVMLP